MITEAEMETRFKRSARAGMAILFSTMIYAAKAGAAPKGAAPKPHFMPAQNF
jgi:hypothetical protein